MPRVEIEASVNPTEDAERVRKAILNLFPDAEGESPERMTGDSLDRLAQRIAEQQIRDTARAILHKSIKKNAITIHLNKQAAYANKVNFTEGGSPLGDINVTIRESDPEQLIREMVG